MLTQIFTIQSKDRWCPHGADAYCRSGDCPHCGPRTQRRRDGFTWEPRR